MDNHENDVTVLATVVAKLEEHIETVESYVATAMHGFVGDPPDSDFQSGYLAALKAVATEGMGIELSPEVDAIEPSPSPPKPPHLRLVQ